MTSKATSFTSLAHLGKAALASIFFAAAFAGAAPVPKAASAELVSAKQANESLYNAIKDTEHTCIAFGGPLAVSEQKILRSRHPSGFVAKSELVPALCELPKPSDIKVFNATPEFVRQHFTEADGVFISGGYEQVTHRAIPFRK